MVYACHCHGAKNQVPVPTRMVEGNAAHCMVEGPNDVCVKGGPKHTCVALAPTLPVSPACVQIAPYSREPALAGGGPG